VKFDLRDGYFHLNINEKDKPYLCFAWGDKFYTFNKFIWGPSTTPFEFQRFMAGIQEKLRIMRIRSAKHLDDWLILGTTRDEALANATKFIDLLNKLRVEINFEKSDLDPKQCFAFCGRTYDTNSFSVKIENSKLKQVIEGIDAICKLEVGKTLLTKNEMFSISSLVQWVTLSNKKVNDLLKEWRAYSKGVSYYERTIRLTNEMIDTLMKLKKVVLSLNEVYDIEVFKDFLKRNYLEEYKNNKFWNKYVQFENKMEVLIKEGFQDNKDIRNLRYVDNFKTVRME